MVSHWTRGCLSHPLKITMGVATVCNIWDGCLNLQWGARERHSPLLPKLLSWEDAISKAEATLKLMSQEQKTSLLQGTGWEPTKWWFDLPKYFYVGNTPAMPEIGLPSLNMQDATDGFRTYWTELSGTITVWPSILAMAATRIGDFRHFPQQDSKIWPIPGRVMGEKWRKGCWELCFPFLDFLGCKTCPQKAIVYGILWYSWLHSRLGNEGHVGPDCRARFCRGRGPGIPRERSQCDPGSGRAGSARGAMWPILRIFCRSGVQDLWFMGVGPCGWSEPSIIESFYGWFSVQVLSIIQFGHVWADSCWFYPTLKHWCHGIHMAYITFPACDPARRQVMIPTWDLSSPGPMSRACSRKACWASWSTGFLTARRRAEVPLIGAHGGAGSMV